jgi:RNA polymerase sigma factor (TIGR02999 family)
MHLSGSARAPEGWVMSSARIDEDTPADTRGEITRLLHEVGRGSDGGGSGALIPVIYEELRVIARSRLRAERPDHTLQSTALVHEAYLRLLGGAERRIPWANRAHFFAAAAEAMRRILLEHARKRGRIKRGGGRRRKRVPLEAVDQVADSDPDQILAVNDAVERLEQRDPRLAQLLKLRFYAGLSVEDTAKAMDLSERTVRREWKLAKAWLARELGDNDDGCSEGDEHEGRNDE